MKAQDTRYDETNLAELPGRLHTPHPRGQFSLGSKLDFALRRASAPNSGVDIGIQQALLAHPDFVFAG